MKEYIVGFLILVGLVGSFYVGSFLENKLESFGGEGEVCYPNRTCQEPFTCFKFRSNYQCEKKVVPAILTDTKYCFSYKGETENFSERCFNTEEDCLGDYNILPSKYDVVRGCVKSLIDMTKPSPSYRKTEGRKIAEQDKEGNVSVYDHKGVVVDTYTPLPSFHPTN